MVHILKPTLAQAIHEQDGISHCYPENDSICVDTKHTLSSYSLGYVGLGCLERAASEACLVMILEHPMSLLPYWYRCHMRMKTEKFKFGPFNRSIMPPKYSTEPRNTSEVIFLMPFCMKDWNFDEMNWDKLKEALNTTQQKDQLKLIHDDHTGDNMQHIIEELHH